MRRILSLLAFVLLAASARAAAPRSDADLVGTWTLVSVENVRPDGSRTQPYGPKPEGRMTLDDRGNYSVLIFRPGRAKFASNDKSKGTPDEYREAVQGSNSHFGRYTVDAAARVITFEIEHASFPNWEGAVQRRSFSLTGDELKQTGTSTAGGAEIAEVIWRRTR